MSPNSSMSTRMIFRSNIAAIRTSHPELTKWSKHSIRYLRELPAWKLSGSSLVIARWSEKVKIITCRMQLKGLKWKVYRTWWALLIGYRKCASQGWSTGFQKGMPAPKLWKISDLSVWETLMIWLCCWFTRLATPRSWKESWKRWCKLSAEVPISWAKCKISPIKPSMKWPNNMSKLEIFLNWLAKKWKHSWIRSKSLNVLKSGEYSSGRKKPFMKPWTKWTIVISSISLMSTFPPKK